MIIEIEHQGWLVDLHPIRPSGDKAAQNLRIDGNETWQQRQRIEALVLALAELEIGDRAEQNGSRVEAEALRFQKFVERLGGRKHERLPARKLGNHVVIVVVKPLGHFERGKVIIMRSTRCAVMIVCGAVGAARHGKIGIDRHLAPAPAINLRDRADHDARVENVVVEREIVARDVRDAEGPLPRPACGAKTRSIR